MTPVDGVSELVQEEYVRLLGEAGISRMDVV